MGVLARVLALVGLRAPDESLDRPGVATTALVEETETETEAEAAPVPTPEPTSANNAAATHMMGEGEGVPTPALNDAAPSIAAAPAPAPSRSQVDDGTATTRAPQGVAGGSGGGATGAVLEPAVVADNMYDAPTEFETLAVHAVAEQPNDQDVNRGVSVGIGAGAGAGAGAGVGAGHVGHTHNADEVPRPTQQTHTMYDVAEEEFSDPHCLDAEFVSAAQVVVFAAMPGPDVCCFSFSAAAAAAALLLVVLFLTGSRLAMTSLSLVGTTGSQTQNTQTVQRVWMWTLNTLRALSHGAVATIASVRLDAWAVDSTAFHPRPALPLPNTSCRDTKPC